MGDRTITTAVFPYLNGPAALGVLACGYAELLLGEWFSALLLAIILIVQLARCAHE